MARVASGGDAVVLHGASVRAGGRAVWSNADLTISPQEFVAVLGPNGAGKSTLLKALLGVMPLSAGTATVFGRPVRRGNDEVGYLPQRRQFDADLRIRAIDLVRMGLDGDRWGLPLPSWISTASSRAIDERVARTLELVGAGDFATRPIGELSGGEQQRVLIAQALVRGPRILMLDEPLDSLDLPNQAAVSALVQRICRAEDVAVLLVAHDVNPLLSYLDQVIYLAGGRALQGPVEKVITSPTLSELYGAPIEVLRTSDGRLVVVGQPEAPHVHGHRHD